MPRTKKNKNKPHVPETPSAQLFAERPSRFPDTPSVQLLAEQPDTPLARKAQLLEDSESESEEYHSAAESPVKGDPSEAGFKINKEYARRFEHNKKREELQRLEEKFGKDDDESSDSEDEDDVAELATEELDQDMFSVLAAIKNKDPRIYDPDATFYKTPIDAPTTITFESAKKEKPMTLKDYHVQNLLKGPEEEEEEEEEDDKVSKKTFAQAQDELKREVASAMHGAVDEAGSDDDEDFLVRKGKPVTSSETKPTPPNLEKADEDPDKFLMQFMQSRVWTRGGNDYTPLEEDDSSDEEKAAEFENAYNLRFEDPESLARAQNIAYSRQAVAAQSLRRDEKSGRKKAREEKRKRKEEEKEQKRREKERLKKLKTDQLMEKFKQIRDAAGWGEDAKVEAEVLEKLLEGEWSDEQWERWVQERFGEEYYAGKDAGEKPVFEDDIDITDIVPDFDREDEDEEEDEVEDEETNDGAKEKEGEAAADENGDVDMDLDDVRPSKKQLATEKKAQQTRDRATRRKLARAVEEDIETDFKGIFRYRETTPESFGLSTLDVLTAGDAELNTFAGLKKYAPFRETEKKKRDKKKLSKKKRLREWRKATFGHEDGVEMPEGWTPVGGFEEKTLEEGEKKKRRRRKTKGENEGARDGERKAKKVKI